MIITRPGSRAALALASFLALACNDNRLEPTIATPSAARASAVANMYAADFVSTAATGFNLNNGGDVVGRSYTDPGCGPFCLPPQDLVVWRGGNRIVLPLVQGFPSAYQFPLYLNSTGAIAGFVGAPGTTNHAAIWTPNGTGYTAQDLGVFPGTSSAEVFGFDDQSRMVGWSTLGGAIPTLTVPFMWTQGTGMVDLKTQGYPNERPAAMSPGGKVVTWNFWYQLGNPATVLPLPPTPRGFAGQGSNGSAINDNGDQAHFLVSTGSQNLVYPFRLSNGGAWQQISTVPTGHLSAAGIGSINASQDISLTAGGNAMIAAGPAGMAQFLAPLLSPAYAGASITGGGQMNNSGQILATVLIGTAPRLMKLVPVVPCTTNCARSSLIQMMGSFVQDPALPGQCFQGGKMYNLVGNRVTVTDENGVKLAGVQVKGRYMDSYWTNKPVSGITNSNGVAQFSTKLSCGVGTVAFLVEGVTAGSRTLDRTVGMLAAAVIPR